MISRVRRFFVNERTARWKRYWTATGVIPRWQLVAVYLAFATACAIGFEQQHEQSQAIQTQRAESIRRQCEDQNRRNKATIARLDLRLKQLEEKAGPVAAARARASRDFTVALIDSLAPPQNCDDVVAQSTTGGK